MLILSTPPPLGALRRFKSIRSRKRKESVKGVHCRHIYRLGTSDNFSISIAAAATHAWH